MAFQWSVSIHLPYPAPDEPRRPRIQVSCFDLSDDDKVIISGEFELWLPASLAESPVAHVEQAAFDYIREHLPRLAAALPTGRS